MSKKFKEFTQKETPAPEDYVVGYETQTGQEIRTPFSKISEKGEPGPQGPAGTNGITYDWLHGKVAPAYTLGKVGDWYMNTVTADVYKKTGSSVWTLQVNLKGTPGDPGTPYEWIDGLTVPSETSGKVGDWYIDTSKSHLYKKTAPAVWTFQADIKGETGNTGATGPAGTTYEWLNGTSVPVGTVGKVGDWYINTATSDVYKKTGTSSWSRQANIKGAAGSAGATGPVGPAGTTYEWLNGTMTPGTSLGKVGDWYVNTNTASIYKKTGSNKWDLQLNIKSGEKNLYFEHTIEEKEPLYALKDLGISNYHIIELAVNDGYRKIQISQATELIENIKLFANKTDAPITLEFFSSDKLICDEQYYEIEKGRYLEINYIKVGGMIIIMGKRNLFEKNL